MCLSKDQGGLGFQDLKAFNLALLAKQGWWLQTSTISLVHGVFKAHYFPSNDFHHTELGNWPSFEWRSIMAAQSIIQHRHRWQGGDGSSIDIRKDKWLPQPSTFCITVPPICMPLDVKVNTLIDPGTRDWNSSMVRHLFGHADATTILGIPVNSKLPRDRILCTYTPKGKFTVRSAYKVAVYLSSNWSPGESSNDQGQRNF